MPEDTTRRPPPLVLPSRTDADASAHMPSAQETLASPFQPHPPRENITGPPTPRHTTPGRPPAALLFGGSAGKPTTSVFGSTGLSLAAGLPSSPSPYLLRSPDVGDYFAARTLAGGDSPLASRHRTTSQPNLAADNPVGLGLDIDPPPASPLRISHDRRSSNGSVSTTSSSSTPPTSAAAIMSALGGPAPTPPAPAPAPVDLTSPPPESAAVSFADAFPDPSTGTVTPQSNILRSSVRSAGSARSTYSNRSARSASIDVDVGVAFPSTSPQKRATVPKRLVQPSVIRSTSGRGIMFMPRSTEAAPVASGGSATTSVSHRAASFAGSSHNTAAGRAGLDIARNRTSLPMSPAAMSSRASSSLAGVLAASSRPAPIPDRLDPVSPEKNQPKFPRARSNSNKSLGALSTRTSGSDAGSTTSAPIPTPVSATSSSGLPRRSNSGTSLRTRFMSSRAAAPEAVVTTTSVSTSLAGGQFTTQNVSHQPEDDRGSSPTTATAPAPSQALKELAATAHRTADAQTADPGDTRAAGMHTRDPTATPSALLAVGSRVGTTPLTLDTSPEARAPSPAADDATEIQVAVRGISSPAISISTRLLSPPLDPKLHASQHQSQPKPPSQPQRETAPQPVQPAQAVVPGVQVPVHPTSTRTTLSPVAVRDVIIESSSTPVYSSSSSTTPIPRPPPPSRAVSAFPTPLPPPRTDDMSLLHAPVYKAPIPPADDYAPHVTARVRGKKAASWHARSDSEGETELHEVDDSPARTAASSLSASASVSATMTSPGSSRDGYTASYDSYASGSGSRNNSISASASTSTSSASGGSPNLSAVDQFGYAPPYVVRRSARITTDGNERNGNKRKHYDTYHYEPSSRNSTPRKNRTKRVAATTESPPRKASTTVFIPTSVSAASRRPEPFTLTLAASLASSLPLPFDRRRIELVLSWSAPEGLWSFVPFAKFVPTWGVVVGGTRATVPTNNGEVTRVQGAFELGGLVRAFVSCIPIVGRFAAWL